jgi:hypothetical protein
MGGMRAAKKMHCTSCMEDVRVAKYKLCISYIACTRVAKKMQCMPCLGDMRAV